MKSSIATLVLGLLLVFLIVKFNSNPTFKVIPETGETEYVSKEECDYPELTYDDMELFRETIITVYAPTYEEDRYIEIQGYDEENAMLILFSEILCSKEQFAKYLVDKYKIVGNNIKCDEKNPEQQAL